MMDEETRQALEGSIKKWERIIAREDVDECGDNCPLCELESRRRSDDDDESCDSCIVAKKTGRSQCDDSPWEEWHSHQYTHTGNVWPYKVKCEDCERLAREELEFLKSLRDE